MIVKICVVIPWRSQKLRIPAQRATVRFYREALDSLDYSIIFADSKGEFNRAEARNIGVSNAIRESADIVIVGDADTIPEKVALLMAINVAITKSECVLPYTQYRSLTNLSTLIYLYLNKKFGASIFKEVFGANGSIYVFRPEVWEKCGGQDQNFKSWGGEDTAFVIAYKRVFNKDFIRIKGIVIALQHGINRRQISEANIKLVQKYKES